MTIMNVMLTLLWMLFSVAAYRLGMADGLSAGRMGRLLGQRPPKEEDTLLKRINAYDGRKGDHGTNN
ncbi:MAG: hypothetical protein IJN80_03560 [Clostridia bacterium]|nr:hypothetical protein [Clostridia bacterium]